MHVKQEFPDISRHNTESDSNPEMPDKQHFSPPDPGTVRIAPIRALPAILRELGVAPGPLLRRCGIADEALFEDPEGVISFERAGKLLQLCARETGCPHFGLLVGQQAHGDCLGAIGLLLASAPDVMAALKEVVANFDVHDRGATAFIEIEGAEALLGYEIYARGVSGAHQISDCAIAIAWNIMRTLCGPVWLPSEVRLRHEQPADIEPYRRFFQAPLKFNARHSSVVFPAEWLAKPIQIADPEFRLHLHQRIQEMRSHSNLGFREQAHRALAMLIGQQGCTLEQLSAHFALHPRTLNRRLREAGTSFRELYGETCQEMARQLLRDTRRNLPSIATLLGYSDETAFNRAFSRREGVSPSKWRRQVREASPLKSPR